MLIVSRSNVSFFLIFARASLPVPLRSNSIYRKKRCVPRGKTRSIVAGIILGWRTIARKCSKGRLNSERKWWKQWRNSRGVSRGENRVNLVAFEQAFRSKISLERKRVERVEWKASNQVFATNCKLKLSRIRFDGNRRRFRIVLRCFVAGESSRSSFFFFPSFETYSFFFFFRIHENGKADRRADSPISERLNT